MKNINKAQLGNYICAFMCLLVLITQFLPFWNCSDCKTHKEADKVVSVAEYIWLPQNHTPITKGMTDVYLEEFGEGLRDVNGKKYKFAVDDILEPCLLTFLGSLAGIALGILFSRRAIISIVPLIVGCAGARWYLICPAMKVGQNWQLHLVVAVLAVLVALIVLMCNLVIPCIRNIATKLKSK